MENYERYNRGSLLNERYLKVEDISEGSYGLVSLAQDTKFDNKLVAVKYIFPADYDRSNRYKELWNKTGRATSSPAKLRSNVDAEKPRGKASKLSAATEESSREIKIHQILGLHPNITNLIDHFDSCLVLEYCPRGDLYEAIQSDFGPSTSQDIKDVFLQILNALSYCHLKLVYHRDLKPENILITEDWLIKVCDWGLATTQREVTNKNEFDVGSERYMAPELFDDDLTFYDAAKVDLWSVGIILLTLVFRKNPFQVANYTDKRFLQFSANREALFDFFSAMSGELFSALRFSLNIDPSNRDLDSLRHEVEKLRFFTMDEEYWAEHSDDGEDEDIGYEAEEEEEDRLRARKKDPDLEDEMFKFDKEKELPTMSLAIPAPAFGPRLRSVSPKKRIQFQENLDITDSDATTTAASAKDEDKDDMPYNRRANALLSPNTGAHPIPISGGNRIRNTRKPFGVASYNKNMGRSQQNGGSFGGKFRREDFFTPRSVAGHYMDKYGEQREQREQKSDKRKKWNRGRKRQSWKKKSDHNGNGHGAHSGNHGNHSAGNGSHSTSGNYSISGVHSTSGAHSANGNTGHGHSHSNSVNSHHRKHRTRRARNEHTSAHAIPNSYSAHSTYLAPTQSVYLSPPTGFLGTGAASSVPSMGFATNGHPLSRAKNFRMKSPQFTKSPQVEPLAEEIDHLALNDDEVFHLENDFEPDEQSTYTAPAYSRGFESRSMFLGQFQDCDSNEGSHRGSVNSSHNEQPQTSITGSAARRHSIDPNHQAKYIPPNRRGSLSGVREKRRSFQPGAPYATIHQTLEEASNSGEWLLRKDWR